MRIRYKFRKKHLLFLVPVFLLAIPVVFAGDPLPPTYVDAINSTITPTTTTSLPALSVLDIVVGAASGAFYGLLGYYTDRSKTGEKLDSKQLGLTVGIGALLGLFIPITAPTDLPGLIGTATTAFGSFGAIYFIQKLLLIAHTLHPPPVAPSPTPVPA
ncbi:MAG TPA: hypothetical protein VEZ43_00165 [Dongiaceae bacterium]|nr:hypothetical protein [Dongiaceae bacterium]